MPGVGKRMSQRIERIRPEDGGRPTAARLRLHAVTGSPRAPGHAELQGSQGLGRRGCASVSSAGVVCGALEPCWSNERASNSGSGCVSFRPCPLSSERTCPSDVLQTESSLSPLCPLCAMVPVSLPSLRSLESLRNDHASSSLSLALPHIARRREPHTATHYIGNQGDCFTVNFAIVQVASLSYLNSCAG